MMLDMKERVNSPAADLAALPRIRLAPASPETPQSECRLLEGERNDRWLALPRHHSHAEDDQEVENAW
jgi:hypothetical protein